LQPLTALTISTNHTEQSTQPSIQPG